MTSTTVYRRKERTVTFLFETMEMERIIKRSNEALDEVALSGRIPYYVWDTCKGVAIITVSQIGLVIAVSDGDGVVMKHNNDGTWGPPSAVYLEGNSLGATFGKATKQIFLFPMSEHALEVLSGKRSNQQNVLMGLAAGPVGLEEGGHVFDGTVATYTYTFQKGAMINVGYDGCNIDAAKKVNADFYGVDKMSTDIVMIPGTVDIPKGKGIEEMHEKLTKLSNK